MIFDATGGEPRFSEMMPPTSAAGFRRTLIKLLKSKLTCTGAVIVLFWLFLGIFARYFSPYGPLDVEMSIRLMPPGFSGHLMGTDNFGRDIFSRLMSGARISLGLGVCSVAISLVAGVLTGGIAGYYGGKASGLLMRFMDIVQAFPTLVLVISLSLAMGRNTYSAMLAIGIAATPQFARLTYAQTSLISTGPMVESARAMGIPEPLILFRHVLPNCLPVIIVRVSFSLGSSILSLASLSFLGIGVKAPTPEWGAMISDSRNFIISGEWWLFTFPGLAIASLILAFNLLGDGLRNVLDPHS